MLANNLQLWGQSGLKIHPDQCLTISNKLCLPILKVPLSPCCYIPCTITCWTNWWTSPYPCLWTRTPLSYPTMIISPVTNEPVHLWIVPYRCLLSILQLGNSAFWCPLSQLVWDVYVFTTNLEKCEGQTLDILPLQCFQFSIIPNTPGHHLEDIIELRDQMTQWFIAG